MVNGKMIRKMAEDMKLLMIYMYMMENLKMGKKTELVFLNIHIQ